MVLPPCPGPWACGISPRVATKDVYPLTDKAIKEILTTVAVRHNQKHHET